MPKIPMTPVDSQRIVAIGYHAPSSTMAVQFPASRSAPRGSTYHYEGVSPEFFAEFQAAESKGKFFEARVRTGGFKYERQPDEQPADEAARLCGQPLSDECHASGCRSDKESNLG